jgi:Alpha/beta hydrolase domain
MTMLLKSKLIAQTVACARLRIVDFCATAISVGSMIAGCGSDTPRNANGSQSDAGMPPSSSASNMSSGGSSGGSNMQTGTAPTSSGTAGGSSSSGAGTQGTGSTAGTGTGGNGTGTSMVDAGAGDAGMSDAGQAPQSDATVEAGPQADCTPVNWANPHMVPNPTVVPVAADAGMGKIFDQQAGLNDYNYAIDEFFFSGTSPVSYTTRMVVKKPKDPAKFSGTVFVEWYNVSGQIDYAVIWANSREYFMREGHVFIGVSAQQVGANALKNIDADRYASINHPGDTYADDIFSQAAVAIRTQSDVLLGQCMPVHAVIAGGQSQSAAQLASYLNNAHPSAEVYDGYDIHSGSEPASNDPGVPTLQIFTMTEGNGSLGDGPHLVEWEVAGSTHNDARITERGQEIAYAAAATGNTVAACVNPLNDYPAYRVYNAAIDHLIRWARKGDRPPAGMPFQTSGGSLALDSHGNVLGGVRIQDIDVPIATYDLNNSSSDQTNFIGSLACNLGGETVPFSAADLMMLYPTHDDYVKQYTAAADKALAAGYELQADHDDAIMQAQAAAIPK